MPDPVLIRWSKRAAIIAGVSFPVVFGIALAIVVFTGGMEGPPPERVDLEILGLALAFYLPFTIMMLSILGCWRRYADSWGAVGRLGCVLALIGLAVVPFTGAAALVGTPQDYAPTEWGRLGTIAVILGTITLGVGFLVLGIAAVRSATPSRRFGMILIGVGLFQGLILLVSVARVLAYSLGWIAFGLALPAVEGKAERDVAVS